MVASLVIGIAAGLSIAPDLTANAADSTANATATRSAELKELNDLRTKVAQTVVCTPAATDTPTATPSPSPTATEVPAVAAGTVVPYGDDWLITALSVQPVSAPDGLKVSGKLIKVILTISNQSDEPISPPVEQLRLIDSNGNQYRLNLKDTMTVGSRDFIVEIDEHTSMDVALVFDVDAGAGTSFLLESSDDPAFKIELAIEVRG